METEPNDDTVQGGVADETPILGYEAMLPDDLREEVAKHGIPEQKRAE